MNIIDVHIQPDNQGYVIRIASEDDTTTCHVEKNELVEILNKLNPNGLKAA